MAQNTKEPFGGRSGSAPANPLAGGEGLASLSKNHMPRSQPSPLLPPLLN